MSRAEGGTNRLVQEMLKVTGRLDQADANGGTPPARPMAKRLLVVDDLASQRELLRAYFRNAPFVSAYAASAQEALGQIDAGARFDGYLLDCAMPDMDGFELAREIKRRVPDALVGFLTASDQLVRLSTLVEEFGDPLYLRKPEDMDSTLVGRIDLWLNGGAAQGVSDKESDARS